MSLQIRKIVLYSLTGQIRELEFRLGELNILTGASKTGKSAVLDIVDYCTGRSECLIAEGIQRNVSWFGVLFEDEGTQTFVARRSPRGTAGSSGDIYVEHGAGLTTPPLDSILKNSSIDAVESRLSRALGIRENRHVARPNQTRTPLEANFRHALLLCLQDQNDIDNRSYLFHRQSETFTANDIRHTIPYFLGAIDEERLLKQAQLDAARQELRRLERRARSAQSADSSEHPRAQTLFDEAVLVGLVNSPLEGSQVNSVLEALRVIPSDGFQSRADPSGSGEEQLAILRTARQSLRVELNGVRDRIREVRLFSSDRGAYEREAREHRSRLSSIGLIQDTNGATDLCPLCRNTLDTPIPSVEQIRQSLGQLDAQLQSVEAEGPRVQEHLIQLTEQEQALVGQLRQNQERINGLTRENDRLSQFQDEIVAQARVVGRISEYLETISEAEDGSDLQSQLEDARRLVDILENELDPNVVHETSDTYLGFVSDYMTEFARRLQLEYSENRVRLDLRRLTVIADTLNGPVALNRMGSGENWVGYHVASHLALHRWFRTKGRPVPGFLILDQPSQAHYPPEQDVDGSIDILDDEDKEAVQELFLLISEVASALAPDLQIIVLDHAKLDEQWFLDAIVEEWRRATGLRLVPDEWMPEVERAWLTPADSSDQQGA